MVSHARQARALPAARWAVFAGRLLYLNCRAGSCYVLRISAESVCRIVAQIARSGIWGRMGRILGRLGTDVGTDKTCKTINVYRPWDGGTDKLGGRRHKHKNRLRPECYRPAPKTLSRMTSLIFQIRAMVMARGRRTRNTMSQRAFIPRLDRLIGNQSPLMDMSPGKRR
jgi:hypothetical protein